MDGLIRRSDVLNEACSGVWDIPKSEIEGVLSNIKDVDVLVELKHFLKFEIQQSTELQKESASPMFDCVCVGSTAAAELRKNHIRFCKHLLSIIEK